MFCARFYKFLTDYAGKTLRHQRFSSKLSTLQKRNNRRGVKLVEGAPLVRTTGALIATVNTGVGLAFGGQTHVRG